MNEAGKPLRIRRLELLIRLHEEAQKRTLFLCADWRRHNQAIEKYRNAYIVATGKTYMCIEGSTYSPYENAQHVKGGDS